MKWGKGKMLKEKIKDLMDRADFMTLSTSVAGNSSAANVYFSNDGFGFGGAQLIRRLKNGFYIGGSESRKDGHVVGF